MFAENFINKLKQGFPEYKFNMNIQGSGWCRAFVTFDGVSLGRFNFEPHGNDRKLHGCKSYKPSDYDYSPEDDIFYLWKLWIDKEIRIDINSLVPIAQQNRLDRIDQIREWRSQHPKRMHMRPDGVVCEKSRHKISTNWMGEFRKLVESEIAKNY